MRTLVLVGILGLVVSFGNVAATNAADNNGTISSSVLADLGLGGMQQMSDEQGMAIRGKGITNGCVVKKPTNCAPAPKCETKQTCETQKQCSPPPSCKPVCRPVSCNTKAKAR